MNTIISIKNQKLVKFPKSFDGFQSCKMGTNRKKTSLKYKFSTSSAESPDDCYLVINSMKQIPFSSGTIL